MRKMRKNLYVFLISPFSIKMALDQNEEVYLDIGEGILQKATKYDGSKRTICYDQAMCQFMLAYSCESIPSHVKEQIQSKIQQVYDVCSAKMQL